jgi:hypothetical protein
VARAEEARSRQVVSWQRAGPFQHEEYRYPESVAAVGATAGLPGAMAGIAAPAVAGRVLMSRPVQAYLGNQLLARRPVAGNRAFDAVRAALLAATSSR